MLRGIDSLEKETRESASISGTGNWINTLKIKDGDIALIRFVTDKEELIRAKYHLVKKTTPKGEFNIPVYCTMEDTGICQNCTSGGVPYSTINLWAYVYYILHRNQNPNIQQGSADGIWKQTKQGKITMYQEDVNDFKLFQTKYGYQGRYKQMFLDFANEYGTLCDRIYSYSRIGATNRDTNYTLMGKKESAIEPEILTKSKTLPSLGDVVSGKVRKFTDNAVKPEEQKTEGEDSKDELDLF